MLRVIAKHYIKEDKVEEYIKIAKELVDETRKEEGNISYGLFQDFEDPTILTMIEEWESKEALDKHMKTPHFVSIVPKLGEFGVKPGEMNLYKEML